MFDMNCPKCNEEIKALDALICKDSTPYECEACRTYVSANRFISQAYINGLFCSLLVIIIPLIAFGNGIFIGFATVSILTALYFLLCFVEVKILGLKIIKSDETTHLISGHRKNTYQNVVSLKV
jgi:hypothetical protein